MSDLLYDLCRICFQGFCSFMKQFFLFLIVFQNTISCQSFNTAHTCCDTGFGNDLEQHDVACVCHMSTTAEFLGEVAHGYHTYLLIIFLSEQSHCSGFLSLFHIHNICTDFKTSLDFFINKRFYLCDLISCHSLEMSKVETKSVWCYQRTLLFYMTSKNCL